MNTALDPPLPYTLRRPFFTVFRRYTIALLPTVALLGVAGGEIVFLTALLSGVVTWLTFGLCLLMAWESITIDEDRLIFNHFRKAYSASYADLAWVDVTRTTVGITAGYQELWVAWKGSEDRPLRMNFGVFAKRDRRLLLRTIAARAPQAPLSDESNELAEALR